MQNTNYYILQISYNLFAYVELENYLVIRKLLKSISIAGLSLIFTKREINIKIKSELSTKKRLLPCLQTLSL